MAIPGTDIAFPPLLALLESVRQHHKPIAELLLEFGAIKGKDRMELKALMVGILLTQRI